MGSSIADSDNIKSFNKLRQVSISSNQHLITRQQWQRLVELLEGQATTELMRMQSTPGLMESCRRLSQTYQRTSETELWQCSELLLLTSSLFNKPLRRCRRRR